MLRSAFTLVELLVVIGIIVLMMGLAIPAFNAIKGGGDLTKATYDIAGTLDQARAYAMANNTFVFVGIAEADASLASSAKPQVTAGSSAIGRVALAVVASKDGTRGYDVLNNNLGSPAWTDYDNGSHLAAISSLRRFDGLHMVGQYSDLPTSGGMSRPTPTVGTGAADFILLGNANSVSVTPFEWPLGSAIGAGQYTFRRVINFDPQGVARIQTATNADNIPRSMEIGLQPSRGNAVSASEPNAAAIQIDGMTGATHIYQP